MAAYPEVREALAALKARGDKLAILSNGDPDMLDDAVKAAKLDGLFDAVLSVSAAATFKPQMKVYQLVLDRFGGKPADVRSSPPTAGTSPAPRRSASAACG